MDYAEARSYVAEISKTGSVYRLDPLNHLLVLLGNPQDELKFIHVAGTNGKGSVLAYLSSILQESGYQVGRYISPTLFSYRERIQVNGTYISREDFARLVTRAAQAMEELKRLGEPLPTVFEFETAVSFLYFCEQRCDIVVLETGLGGPMDATNVAETKVLTVMTSIGMDHMEFLGNTLAEITKSEAGIFRPAVPVVSAAQEEHAAAAIREEAERLGCELHFVQKDAITDISYGIEKQLFSYRGYEHLVISLAGKHQIGNAALALEAVAALKESDWVIDDAAVYRGLEKTVWKGRFSVIAREPYVILDGAHNEDAAKVLRDSVEEYFPDCRKYFIFGVFSDKEYDKIIDITAELADHIVTVETPGNPRALPAKELAEAVRLRNPSVEASGSIHDAVQRCLEIAGKNDLILIFGSLSFLGIAEQEIAAGMAGGRR
ncbi:MAG: folylpolyglutamate synthase/dihydrofolate synthase family protein [Lachnospiraceae bacterium]|nr:folylpolyglutamate synthase/dihydrofolate synthase family protein [Lachnospiraceae bacterium]